MKRLLVLFFVISMFTAEAQTQQLEWKRGTLQVDGKGVQVKNWENHFTNSDALAYVRKAKANAGPANALAFVGGFLIGWPIGTAIGGGEPEWAMAGAGAGIIVVALPLISATKKNMQKAIQLEKGANVSGSVRLDFEMGKNGIGLALKF